jgi:hypothetical protein
MKHDATSEGKRASVNWKKNQTITIDNVIHAVSEENKLLPN